LSIQYIFAQPWFEVVWMGMKMFEFRGNYSNGTNSEINYKNGTNTEINYKNRTNSDKNGTNPMPLFKLAWYWHYFCNIFANWNHLSKFLLNFSRAQVAFIRKIKKLFSKNYEGISREYMKRECLIC
jgi:hypothetical protein